MVVLFKLYNNKLLVMIFCVTFAISLCAKALISLHFHPDLPLSCGFVVVLQTTCPSAVWLTLTKISGTSPHKNNILTRHKKTKSPFGHRNCNRNTRLCFLFFFS